MTAQVPDIIIMDGKALDLNATPLEGYFSRVQWWPGFNYFSTAHYRGYVARWEIHRKHLYLTGLLGYGWCVPDHLQDKVGPDPDPFTPGEKNLRLADLFPDQAPLVPATWVTGRLVVPLGSCVYYVHHAFGSLYEAYRIVNVVQGRVWRIRDFDGREWCRRTGRYWPLDEDFEANPMALAWPVPETDEVAVEDEQPLPDWRLEEVPSKRYSLYQDAQERPLRAPCGEVPKHPPSASARPGRKRRRRGKRARRFTRAA